MKKASLLSFSLFSAFVHLPASAEHQLPEMTVTGQSMSLVVPTVQEAEEKLREVPGGTALISSEAFENKRATNVKDIFSYTPGVLAQARIAEEARLSIRGSGLSRTYHLRGLTLLQDGIPLNLADGNADFQNIDPLSFRYVEVYKGANGLAFGANSLGGAINFVSPTGYDAEKLMLRGDAGSFDSYRQQVSSGQVIGKTDYFAYLSHVSSSGYRDFSDQNNTRFSGNLGHKFSDQLETRFYFNYGDINQELPGNLTKAQLKANPRQANSVNLANNWQRDYSIYRIANKTSWQGDGVAVNAGLYTTQKDLYHPIFQLIDEQNSDYGAFANTEIESKIFGKANILHLGLQGSLGTNDAKRYVNQRGNYGALTTNSKQDASNTDLYFENRTYLLNNVAFVAGSKFSYAGRELTDYFLSNGDQSGEKNYYGASPKLGLLWDVTPSIQLFTNLSRAYEAPTFSELAQLLPGSSGLADIKAQKSTTLEIGSRGEWQQIGWDISLYRAHLTDELMMYSLGNGQSGVLNSDKTIHQGIELGMNIPLLEGVFTGTEVKDKVSLRTAYSYNDFHFDDDPAWGDNQIPGAPKHMMRSELRYTHPSGFYLAPNLELVPESYAVDMQNSLFADSYALLGLEAGYKLKQNVTVFLDARNLTDKTYAATADVITAPTATNTAIFTPGDGRSVYVGVRYSW